MIRAHLLISGLVQGVCFRVETKYQAEALNLTGWVKNTPDAKVEAVFEGDRPYIEKMIQWCKKGPPGAIVNNVHVNWEEYAGEYKEFYIK